MTSEKKIQPRDVFTPWLRSTFLGWSLGVLLTIIAVIAADNVGLSGTQFLIGASMGAGVGYVQARAMKRLFGESGHWLLITVLGTTLPFLFFDFSRVLKVEIGYSLPLCVAVGGILVGVLQRGILRSYAERVNWWIPASVLGWLFAAGAVMLNDAWLQEVLRRHIRGVAGALIYIGVILSGGLALGAVTGGVLQMMLRSRAVPSNPK